MKTAEQILREQLQEREEKRSKPSVFETLSAINVNEHAEKKGGLTYLSWAWAWSIAKKNYPEATYTVYENGEGCPYFTDGITCWVKTGVTIEGLEHIEYLPIMDYKNQSIPVGKVTSMDMNKAIQRSLTKALARHGLGLYIYAGEDLPEQGSEPIEAATQAPAPAPTMTPYTTPKKQTTPAPKPTSTGLTPEHSKAYRAEMTKFQQEYEQTMGEPLYKAVLRELGTRDFKSIPDSRFEELMGVIDTCRRIVQE